MFQRMDKEKKSKENFISRVTPQTGKKHSQWNLDVESDNAEPTVWGVILQEA